MRRAAHFRRVGRSVLGAVVVGAFGVVAGVGTGLAGATTAMVGTCNLPCRLPADTVSIVVVADATAGSFGSNAGPNAGGIFGLGEDVTAQFLVGGSSSVQPGDRITPYGLAGGSGGSGNELGGGGGSGGIGLGVADMRSGQWLVVAAGGGGGGGAGGFAAGGSGGNASPTLTSSCSLSIPPSGSNNGAGGTGGSAGTATDAGGGGGGGGGCPAGAGGSPGGIGAGGGGGGGAGGNFVNPAAGDSFILAPSSFSGFVYVLYFTEASNSTAPSIASTAQATFTVGQSGAFTIMAMGDPTPSLSERGSLPTGVSFTDEGGGLGSLSGTPAAGTGGTYPITVIASNGTVPDATQLFTLTVDEAPAFFPLTAPTFTVGLSSPAFDFGASGYPAPVLNLVGTLPAGLTFSDHGDGTGSVSGMPRAGTGGSYPVTLTASNIVGSTSVNFTITVDEAPAIASPAQATFIVGQSEAFAVQSSGYPTATLSESGSLPAGLSFRPGANGTASISGIPQAGSAGSYPITLAATNGVSPPATESFTVTVDQVPLLTSASSTAFTVGKAGSLTVTTSGFPAPALTESGALPRGVGFTDNGNGTATLAGTPSVGSGGLYTFAITASNGVSPPAAQAFVLTVHEAPDFKSPSSATVAAKSSFSVTVTTRGYPAPALSESGKLPKGVSFVDNGNGTARLSGNMNKKGTFSLTFTAENSIASATQTFTLTDDKP